MKREIDKVDKYLQKACDQYVESDRSAYYRFGGKIIRVSDHIGNTSDGTFHIIVKPNGYLIHHPLTGTIHIVDYEQVKEFIRVFRLFPFADLTNQPDALEPSPVKELTERVANSDGADSILGVPAAMFTKGQLNVIRQTAMKALHGQPDAIGDQKVKPLYVKPIQGTTGTVKADPKKVEADPKKVEAPVDNKKPVKLHNIDVSVLD